MRAVGPKMQNTTGSTDDWRISFAKAVTSGVDTDNFTIIPAIGTGMGVSQANGNLRVTSGTTVNAETVIRSNIAFNNDIILRYGMALSQRIVNQQFFVELVDVLGDALAVTINSATSITVTMPDHKFTAGNIGQFMYVGNYTGTGTFISGRYAIASITDTTVTYTVAGFAAGAGTVSVFGANYHHVIYDGTTATSAKYDAQRRGYASGDSGVTINTTAGAGHSGVISVINSLATFADHGPTGGALTVRLDRTANVPVDADRLYLQIRVVNGSVAPASTTTMTMNYVSVIQADSPLVTLAGSVGGSSNSPQQVQLSGTNTVLTQETIKLQGTALSVVTAATTNASIQKSTAGNLFELTVSNVTASSMAVKLYNKATAPTVGTDVPLVTQVVAAGGTTVLSFGELGKRFTAGIAMAVTAQPAVADTTAAAAGAQIHGTYI